MENSLNSFEVSKIKRYYHYNLSKSYRFVGHRHRSFEINMVLNGELEIIVDKYVFPLRTGSMLITESNIFHSNRVLSENGVELIVIMFYTDDISLIGEPRVFSLNNSQKQIVNLLIEESEFCSSYNSLNAKKLLEVLLSRLVPQKSNVLSLNNKNIIIYNKAVEYLKKHVNKSVTISELAKACETSATPLKSIFSKYTGMGINEYFTELKIHIAKELMQEGYCMSEISERLGFSSQAYFSQVFKKLTNKSPLNYKKDITNQLIK